MHVLVTVVAGDVWQTHTHHTPLTHIHTQHPHTLPHTPRTLTHTQHTLPTHQDALDEGWLRTERSLLSGAPNTLAVLVTAWEIASGLAYMHSMDIVHGDLR